MEHVDQRLIFLLYAVQTIITYKIQLHHNPSASAQMLQLYHLHIPNALPFSIVLPISMQLLLAPINIALLALAMTYFWLLLMPILMDGAFLPSAQALVLMVLTLKKFQLASEFARL